MSQLNDLAYYINPLVGIEESKHEKAQQDETLIEKSIGQLEKSFESIDEIGLAAALFIKD